MAKLDLSQLTTENLAKGMAARNSRQNSGYSRASRSQGQQRAQNRQREAVVGQRNAGSGVKTHTEFDKTPKYAGGSYGVYSPPRTAAKGYVPSGQGTLRGPSSMSRSQGSHQRSRPQEDQAGFNPATMGNKRYGKGATAPFSRSNATKRRKLQSMARLSNAARRKLQNSGDYSRGGAH